jgi:hypothetical protein
MDTEPMRPEFNDPQLRRALQEGAPAIEKFTARLDELSADIKNLEAFLEKSAVRMTVRVRFPGPPVRRRSRSWGADEEGDDATFGEFLAWAKGEPDRFRIIYFQVVPGEEYPEERDNCVLIEAPLELRVRARPMLPKLLLKVSEAAKLGDDEAQGQGETELAPPSDDDIPF